MRNYKRNLEFFSQVKDTLNPVELKYLLNQIDEYDSCNNSKESQRIEQGLIAFCEKNLTRINKDVKC